VTLADGSYIAAGSAVTADVPAGALAIGRARQENKTAGSRNANRSSQRIPYVRIVGYIGPKPVVPVLLDGLRRLEYRGMTRPRAVVPGRRGGSAAQRRQADQSRERDPEQAARRPLRTWPHPLATHGRPTEENAHPHRDGSGRIVVVHNGIIENYLEIKRELVAEGHKFESETDTEVVAHLVEKEWKNDGLENAVLRAMKRVRGLFALVLMSADDPEKLVAVRNGPPIVVGMGDGEYFVALTCRRS
jgi:glucosamine--fructose-6-phosphate aminotransferase (isomerizing)